MQTAWQQPRSSFAVVQELLLQSFDTENVALWGCGYLGAFSFTTNSSLPIPCCLHLQSEVNNPAFDAAARAIAA